MNNVPPDQPRECTNKQISPHCERFTVVFFLFLIDTAENQTLEVELCPTLFGGFAQLAREEGHPVLMEVRSLDCHLVCCLRNAEELQIPASTILKIRNINADVAALALRRLLKINLV